MQRKQYTRRTPTHASHTETDSSSNTGNRVGHHTGRTDSDTVRSSSVDRVGHQDKQHTPDNTRRAANPLADMPNDLEPVYGTQKHAGGRPTDYTPDVCDKVIEWGKQGYSKTEMCSELGIHRDTMYEWAKVHEEFSDTLLVAMSHSEAWWEREARTGITKAASAFNSGLFGKIMSARFPETYRETTRTEHSGPEGAPIPVAVANAALTGEGLKDYYKQFMDKATQHKNASSV